MEKKKALCDVTEGTKVYPGLATMPVRCELRPLMIPLILLFCPTKALVSARSEKIFFSLQAVNRGLNRLFSAELCSIYL